MDSGEEAASFSSIFEYSSNQDCQTGARHERSASIFININPSPSDKRRPFKNLRGGFIARGRVLVSVKNRRFLQTSVQRRSPAPAATHSATSLRKAIGLFTTLINDLVKTRKT